MYLFSIVKFFIKWNHFWELKYNQCMPLWRGILKLFPRTLWLSSASITSNVCSELFLKHLSSLSYSWYLLGWWFGAYRRKNNLRSFYISIGVVPGIVISFTHIPTLRTRFDFTSHFCYFPLQFSLHNPQFIFLF